MIRATWILLAYLFSVHVIFVHSLLNVVTKPKAVLQVAKTEVKIECKVIPDTGVRVTWQKDKTILPDWTPGSPTDGVYVIPDDNTLYIPSVKRRNTGMYKCVAFSQTTGETTYSEATVEIKYIQRLAPIPPVRVYKGSNAKIVCQQPLANPFAAVSWKLNGTDIMKTSHIDPTDWTLTISNVNSSDAGTYTCVATNSANVRTENTTLSIIIPGVVVANPTNDQVFEKEPAQFTCRSTAQPPLETVWKRVTKTCPSADKCTNIETTLKSSDDGRVFVENGVLKITETVPEDKGVYKCEASLGSSYDSTNVTLNVIETLKEDKATHQRFQSIDIRQKKGRISCQFRGDVDYTVAWSRGNETLRQGISANGSTLVIKDVQFSDEGLYLCTATSNVNTAKAEVQLDVFKSPIFVIKPKNITQNEGKPAWVDCTGEGEPMPRVSYHRDRQSENLNASHFQMLPNGTLHIKNLKKEDQGIYYCWLTTKQKIEYESFRIVVLDAEPGAPPSNSPMGRTVGIAVGCAGVYILLVIGLMIYCRARRARLLKKGLITEADDCDVKDPLVNGEDIPLETAKSLDSWQVPKEQVSEVTTLGFGKMGRVFKAVVTTDKHPDGALVAVKESGGVTEQQKEEFNLEVEMFLQLNHENLVKLIGVSSLSTPYYTMIEFSEIGSLKEHLVNSPTITEANRCSMSLDIARGMEYLVSLRYIHRDLSTRNCIAISNDKVKISFLSLCEDVSKDDYYLLNDIPVPLRWLSPEAITNESYSEKSDVWSFGVTLWEVFSGGQKPYADYDNEQVRDGVCKDLRLPLPEKCPLHVFEVMKKCWIIDTHTRPTFQELVTEIEEKFKMTDS